MYSNFMHIQKVVLDYTAKIAGGLPDLATTIVCKVDTCIERRLMVNERLI